MYFIREMRSGPPKWKFRCWHAFNVFVLLLLFMQIHAQQQVPVLVTLTAKERTLRDVFKDLEKQTGFSINYQDNVINASQKVTITVVQKPFGTTLQQLLNSNGVTFRQQGNMIILQKKPVLQKKDPGKVTGKILDEENGQVIANASIRIGNEFVIADIDGRFSVSLSEGAYTAEISSVGYGKKMITDIKVANGQISDLNVALKRGKGQLTAVVVTASAKKEGTASLLLLQKNRTAISDGISYELIRRTPDRNAGDALKRVTGVSVLEGKYVVVRGLSDRYNYTMLNGGILPSTEPDRRTFSLDLIPALAIENIVVSKTATADLPGEFAGGVVQVTTRDFPEKNFFSVAVGSGFYAGQTGKSFFKDQNGSKDWMGISGNNRAIPKELDVPSQQLEKYYPEERFRLSNLLSKGWTPVQVSNAKPIEQFQLGFGKNIFFKDGAKFGIIAIANYRNDQTIDQVSRYDLASYGKSGDGKKGDTIAFLRSFPYERSYRYLVNEGGLLNLAYQFGKNKVSFKTIYNRDFETVTTIKEGEKTLGNGFSDIVPYKVLDMHPTQKTLLGNQLQGEHKLGLENPVTLTWNVAYNIIKKQEPNQSRISYHNLYTADTVAYKDENYFQPLFGSLETTSRLYSDLREDAYNLNFAIAAPFKIGKQSQLFKAGAFSQFRKRKYATRNLGFYDSGRGLHSPNENQGFPSSTPVDMSQPIGDILSPVNFRPGGWVAVNFELPANEYTGGANLASAFVNMESNVLDKLKFVYGARVEFYTMSLSTSKDLTRRLPGSGGSGDDQTPVDFIRYNTDVLPSFNLIYSPISSVNIRAAYSKTLTRPEFREVSPYAYFDFVNGYVTLGNTNLNRGTIQNLDFRAEWFPAPGEILSGSIFRKKLHDPVEITTQATSETALYQRYYKNVDEALNWGIEFELRKSLYFGAGPEWLRNIIVFGNYSRIHSNISGKADPIPGEVAPRLRERPLMGQSPYLLNAGLLVNAFKNTFSFSAALNRAGRRIVVVGTTAEDRAAIGAYPDIYENPRNQLDIQLSQKFFKQRFEVRINAANLLHEDFIQYQDFDQNGKYSGKFFDATTYARKSFSQYTLMLSYIFSR